MAYRSKAKEAADARYRANNRARLNDTQREKFGSIGATFTHDEKRDIKNAITGAGLVPADIFRAAAQMLTADPAGAGAAIRAAVEKWRADHPQTGPGRPKKDQDNTPPEALATGQDGQKDTGPENSPKD